MLFQTVINSPLKTNELHLSADLSKYLVYINEICFTVLVHSLQCHPKVNLQLIKLCCQLENMIHLGALNSISAGLGLISNCVLEGNLGFIYIMLGILTKLSSSSASSSSSSCIGCSQFSFVFSFLASLCNLCYFDHKLDGLPRLFDIPQDMAESQNEARAKAEAETYFIFPNDSTQNVSKEREGGESQSGTQKRKRKNRNPNRN